MIAAKKKIRILLSILLILLVLLALTYCTKIYANVVTENGLKYYAEKAWKGIMPLNCVVNVGYVLVGFYWLKRQPNDQWIYTFSLMSIMYSPIQLLRILTQTQEWSVMDQWVTLPIFAWFLSWCCHIYFTISNISAIFIMVFSVLSYNFVLISSVGFEIMLAIHIMGVLILTVLICVKYTSITLLKVYSLALLSLFGFVVLKLLDHDLVKVHSVFSVISGHFLSKICDFMQIHFGCAFIEQVYIEKLRKVK